MRWSKPIAPTNPCFAAPREHRHVIGADTPILRIDPAAIAANWRLLDAQNRSITPQAATGAAVKANAYGVGVEIAAPALAEAGCRHFFTATLDEAIALRALLPDIWVAVLNGIPRGAAPEFIAHHLHPVLNTLPDLADWQRVAAHPTAPAALLHLDTGMARLGLDADDIAQLIDNPAWLGTIRLDYIMSHFAAAEIPNAPSNQAQSSHFAGTYAHLTRAWGQRPKTSLANSAALFLGPLAASDLARPGYALYGGNPTQAAPNPMRPVLHLAAPVLQIREIPRGASVGYNATWSAPRRTRVATIAIGYADGIFRAASNRLTARHRCKIIQQIGRVSMDLITFDVTDHPDIQRGSLLTLLDEVQTIETLAEQANSSGYEVLTRLGPRYRRVVEPLYTDI
jgi:alanine racemase